jgi:hypothetical protein
LVAKFPTSAESARGIKETNWQERLFVPHVEGDTTYVPLPLNLNDFDENIVMISLIKAIEFLGYTPVEGNARLPTTVFKTDKGMYLAGFISMSISDTCPKRTKATNHYERGSLAAATDAVIAKVGSRNAHIRRCEHNVGKLLAEMPGFSREYWSLRGAISNILKRLPKPFVSKDIIPSYMLTGGELIGKVVRSKLPWQNGGIYRQSEIEYLSRYYQSIVAKYDEIVALCKNPTGEFAEHFWEMIDSFTENVKKVERRISPLFAKRARIIFRNPSSKKKQDIQWNRLSLDDKLHELAPDQFTLLYGPTSLPGLDTPIRVAPQGDDLADYCEQKYSLSTTDQLYTEKMKVVSEYETILAVLVDNQ